MKLGCCLNMLGDKNDAVGRRYIGTLKEAGYDYMELPLAQIMELSETSFSELAEEAEKTGLPCECCNNFFPGIGEADRGNGRSRKSTGICKKSNRQSG